MNTKKQILVTGANGFVGNKVCQALAGAGYPVVGSVRDKTRIQSVIQPQELFISGSLQSPIDWSDGLRGTQAIVHLAGIATAESVSRDEIFKVNVEATRDLAQQAAVQGVQRFIYLSSIKVLGEESGERAFRHGDLPRPEDDYARSRLAAEQALQQIAATTDMELVIIRPGMIYGPGSDGNLLRLTRLFQRRTPLPFASVKNHRSMHSISNLCDLILLCINQPEAAGRILLAADQEDMSTPQLVRTIAETLNQNAILFPCPQSFLLGLGRLLGRKGEVRRLVNNLQIDISHTRQVLNWAPRVSLSSGIRETVTWFVDHPD